MSPGRPSAWPGPTQARGDPALQVGDGNGDDARHQAGTGPAGPDESGQGVVAFCRAAGRSSGVVRIVANDRKVDFKTEATAGARRTGDAQLAAHQFDQLAGDR